MASVLRRRISCPVLLSVSLPESCPATACETRCNNEEKAVDKPKNNLTSCQWKVRGSEHTCRELLGSLTKPVEDLIVFCPPKFAVVPQRS